ncbi:hypothetical protein [Okeania sp. SIO2B3]|uniref:hypothetical protein n=1 Tax=Okeania sp. SIO2B3 TaxID=2607784 RepID=UPI0013C13559|nr:hypothetical protein [Okeania sp. SIO2B3]NET44288.1 hypothetical protein [Okeania sp. SIO2B3]
MKKEDGTSGWALKPQQACKHPVDDGILNPKKKIISKLTRQWKVFEITIAS